MTNRYSLRWLLVVQIVLAFLILLAAQCSRSRSSMPPPLSFDAKVWREADLTAGAWTVRSQMIDDLSASHNFVGMSRDEVIQLLGEPTKVVNPDFKDWDLLYKLGLKRKEFPQDYEFLAFKFDDNGRVSQFQTVCE